MKEEAMVNIGIEHRIEMSCRRDHQKKDENVSGQ
jgi:hypothetical protein